MNGGERLMRLPVPGPACGAYPERAGPFDDESAWSRAWLALRGALADAFSQSAHRQFVARVRAAQTALPACGSQAFGQRLRQLRAALGGQGFTEPLLVEAFALVAHNTREVLQLELFDTQLVAARILLDNRLAEMATGEGKTLAAMLAGATAALAGVPVHVVTANAYLAGRDAGQLAAVYAALGLRSAAIRPASDEAERRAAYGCDIVHCTASDLIFDYLRDRTAAAGTPPLMRGLCMAIVDEADGVLIDEARTPFILARERRDAAAERRLRSALALAQSLQPGLHFRLDPSLRRAHLEPAGQQACADALAQMPSADALWTNRHFRAELVELALAALHLYRRDEHYLLAEEGGADRNASRIRIIDATTGRVATGRRWSNGLHQLVELKEGCEPAPLQQTSAQLTYQRFFPRYWRLCGMSGTLREARGELRHVYRMPVQRVALRLPGRRIVLPPQIFTDAPTRWDAVVAAIAQAQAGGRPVLVGTDSVADAMRLSQRLQARGIAHQRLDARQDADEAACIARAGQAGCVTVATNMAGRGTDIVLGDGVAARGGLFVIACQQNASARIDRQLYGRAARAGDPGSVRTMLALDEGLLALSLPRWCRWLLRRSASRGRILPGGLSRWILGCLQAIEERRERRQRAQLLKSDRQTVRGLGFGARAE